VGIGYMVQWFTPRRGLASQGGLAMGMLDVLDDVAVDVLVGRSVRGQGGPQ